MGWGESTGGGAWWCARVISRAFGMGRFALQQKYGWDGGIFFVVSVGLCAFCGLWTSLMCFFCVSWQSSFFAFWLAVPAWSSKGTARGLDDCLYGFRVGVCGFLLFTISKMIGKSDQPSLRPLRELLHMSPTKKRFQHHSDFCIF